MSFNHPIFDNMSYSIFFCGSAAAPILPIYSKPKRVLQGDPLRISCRVSGYPTPSAVEWFFAPIPVELSDDKTTTSEAINALASINFETSDWADSKLSSEDGTPNDTLRFTSLAINHNGLFACKSSNDVGNDTTLLLVGVKSKLHFVGVQRSISLCFIYTWSLL